jgi:3-oxoacyl-[acyl-carrier protein] reductase
MSSSIPAKDVLAGKRALVTGASRGIGREIARALSRAGAHVAINFRQRAEAAESLRREIVAEGGHAITVQADVSRAGEVETMLATVHAKLGDIDILVNNAGLSRPVAIDKLAEADWNEAIDTNLKSAFLATQGCLPGMRSQRWGPTIPWPGLNSFRSVTSANPKMSLPQSCYWRKMDTSPDRPST